MAITYRAIAPEEAGAFFDADSFGFGQDPEPAWRAATLEYADLSRTTAALEGSEIVGTAGVWTFDMTVPGATMPCGGVTWVSVAPTHRRRGILTGMMRSQLEAIRERGEAIAALWASEAPIYGRFGYGIAAEGVQLRIERAHSGIAHRVPYSGRTRRVSREEALADWPAVYDQVRAAVPGLISRSEKWWANRHVRPPEIERPMPGYSHSFLVQYDEDGVTRGYVRYRIRGDERDGVPASELRVGELMAASDEAYAALWDYVFGVDLIRTISADWRPIDEPLLHMLADPRRLVRRTQDTLHVRLVDAARALSARRYAVDGRLVFDIRDPFLPWVAGRFRLEGGPGGAQCVPTTETAAISLGAAELGAAFLGYARFSTLARAGRVTGDVRALRLADLMFGWNPLPWGAEVF